MTSFEDSWAQVVFEQAKDRILGTAGTQVPFHFFLVIKKHMTFISHGIYVLVPRVFVFRVNLGKPLD